MSRISRRETLRLLGYSVGGSILMPIPTWAKDLGLLTDIQVRGIYLPGWKGVTRTRIQKVVDFLVANKLNTLMIDVKNALGELFYQPESELALRIGAQVSTIDGHKRSLDLDYLVSESHKRYIRIIARHTMFVDKALYKGVPEFGLAIGHNQYWVDMGDDDVVDYDLELLSQEAKFGFDEIVLDYIRYPDLPGFGKEDDRCDRIDRVAQLVQRILKGANVQLGLQVFGYSAWSHYKSNVGQRIETLQHYADRIYPMLYPSHFYGGTMGFARPEEHPFEIISMGYREAVAKITTDCQIIPMIQGFSYSPEQIAQQIKAVRKQNMPGFISWNPAGNHRKLAFALELF
ncbi:putative glycoside hydrolase [Mangrovibacterium lignilyticum]|uniref:putative glycoside hydrolase n=1 Tax=Mangrovibacterium lignilyticum TaxID=2668052 RepID=UPI0013D12C84|nr:putative glycoside hydrolase [Mangrovibacterium lignilyticum]